MFGEIVNGEMCLNDIGQLTQSIWNNLPGRFPQVELDEFIIMPNHLHGIIIRGGTYSDAQKAAYASKVPERFQQYMSTTPSTVHQRVTEAPPPHPVGRDKSGPYAVDASRPHRE